MDLDIIFFECFFDNLFLNKKLIHIRNALIMEVKLQV